MLCKAPRAGLDRCYANFNYYYYYYYCYYYYYYYYYYSAHPVSFLTITRFVKLFEAALKLGSVDLSASNTAKHPRKVKSYSQAFRFQKKTEKSLGNTKIEA